MSYVDMTYKYNYFMTLNYMMENKNDNLINQ